MTQDPGADSPMAERMQSMFSRAVEEQLTEQRQVAGLLAQVQGQLGRLEEQLQEMRLLGERVDGVARLVQERGRDLAEQRAAIADLKAAVDDHTHALTGSTGGDSLGDAPGLGELVAGVGALQQRAEALDAGLRELRQAFSGVAARAAQLPGRDDIDAVRQRLDTLDAVTTRLDALHEELFGVDGLADRMDARAGEQPLMAESARAGSDRPGATQDVEAVVARAVADSERRLAEHVDSAILTLAEALLRRRAPRPARVEAPAVAPPVDGGATTGATPMSEDDAYDDEYDDADVDGALASGAASGAPSAPLHAQGVGPAPSLQTPDPTPGSTLPPSAVPPTAVPPSEPEEAGDQSADTGRKPWWRPGG